MCCCFSLKWLDAAVSFRSSSNDKPLLSRLIYIIFTISKLASKGNSSLLEVFVSKHIFEFSAAMG